MSRYPPLPEFIREALTRIEPSGDERLFYYPCRVTLKSGEILDAVYIEPEKPYLRFWGVYPEDDRAKKWICIEDIAGVEESTVRLPAKFANQIVESGMGYCLFTLVFSDGSKQACGSGSAVDFIQYPTGKGPADVVEVTQEDRNYEVKAPEYYWCLYSEHPE